MATNRKPTSPSATSAPGSEPPTTGGEHDSAGGPPDMAADGDFTLDDYEDRQQQQPRPRLPEQRRESISFEMSGSASPERETAARPDIEGVSEIPAEAEVPSAEDIANYDLGPVATAGVVAAPSKAAPSPVKEVPLSSGLDD